MCGGDISFICECWTGSRLECRDYANRASVAKVSMETFTLGCWTWSLESSMLRLCWLSCRGTQFSVKRQQRERASRNHSQRWMKGTWSLADMQLPRIKLALAGGRSSCWLLFGQAYPWWRESVASSRATWDESRAEALQSPGRTESRPGWS